MEISCDTLSGFVILKAQLSKITAVIVYYIVSSQKFHLIRSDENIFFYKGYKGKELISFPFKIIKVY